MVKRTCPAKTRIKIDIHNRFFFSRGSMHGFGFQFDLKVLETFLKASTEKFCQII